MNRTCSWCGKTRPSHRQKYCSYDCFVIARKVYFQKRQRQRYLRLHPNAQFNTTDRRGRPSDIELLDPVMFPGDFNPKPIKNYDDYLATAAAHDKHMMDKYGMPPGAVLPQQSPGIKGRKIA